ncbi:MAG TPA: response regulator transcription factor [Candidatus Mediterraneibacter merdipullorum]|nr:response regulator transcription factor [Candidatus Mediterraneibacter merdipullorum]
MTDILLVEDEESVNRGIEFTLTKEGYLVETAGTLREAEKILEKDCPRMVICDLNLPDGSGLDFIRSIRQKSMAHIICLTALDTEMDQVMGYEAGADDYVTKPFSLSVLVLKVNAYFNRRQTDAASVVESGGIRFNLLEMTARKDGQDISFTKNEWKMLKMFLENPRQILSRNQILERLFDAEGDFVDDNTVAVNIRRLRAKIETDSSQPKLIRNVRGLGYIWDCDCRKGEAGAV